MVRAGQAVEATPTIPSQMTLQLRAKLLMEEVLETIRAMGIQPALLLPDGHRQLIHSIEDLDFDGDSEMTPDLEGIADGCADLSVVLTGTLLSCGIHDVELLEEVDAANLRKFGPGSYLREDGKLIKPPDFQPPDIRKVLALQNHGGPPDCT